jgi:SAM-dependent methyltransferase
MDFADPRVRSAFFEVHRDMPREGPGNAASTARALELCGRLPAAPRVLDIACGPGQQTMDLAKLLPSATITAVDNHAPFVDEANRRAAAAGVAQRVRAVVGDMAALDFPPNSFDLIWCEGAAYIMGVGEALAAWRPLLKPEGRLALTEAVWLRSYPPEEVRRCWAEDYPAMVDVAGCRDIVARAGFSLLGDFVLPEAAWWDDYYTPMEKRLAEVAPQFKDDEVGQNVIDLCYEEIEVYRKYSAYYGYVFLVMTPDPSLSSE